MRSPARLAAFSVLFVLGCRPPQALPERIELDPGELMLQFGEAQPVSARALQGTKEISIEGLTWTSSDPTVVSVTETDLGLASVQGFNGGTATITALLRAATATLEVTVAPRVIVLERIDLTPVDPLVAKGLRLQLRATGTYNDGSTKDLTAIAAWASADSTKATVVGGLVSTVNPGAVEIRALKDGVTGRAALTVTAASIVAIDVRPAMASLARGTSQQLSATARLSDATTQVVTSQVTWSSGEPTIASVDAAGRVTANTVGTTTLSATLGEVSGTSMVTVTSAVLRSLDVTPATLSLPLGSTQQLTVTGHFSDASQQDLTSQASWRSGTPLVATVSTGGLVTSVGLGLSVITATVDVISGNTSITGTAAQLQMIHVAPLGLSLAVGLTRTFTATGLYTDSSTQDLTAALTWGSSDAGVATVSNLAADVGLVRAVTVGTTSISATNGTLTGSSDLVVAPAMLLSLQITPLTASIAKGLTRQLAARGTFSDGSQRDVTAQVTWVSAAAAVADVSNALGTEGLITALTLGTAVVTANSGLVSASMNVDVVAPVLQRIDVTAAASSIAKGRAQQLTATGIFSDGSSQDLSSTASWAPATGTIFRVSSAGLMTALAVGTANATATSGTVAGTAPFTVTIAELDSLSVTPAAPSIALGLTRPLVALGLYSDGTSAPVAGVTWLSATTTVATVSTVGLVSSVAEGTSLVSATLGSLSGSTTVTISPPVLVTLTVTPGTFALDKTQTQQLAVDGLYSDGSTATLTNSVAWLSAAPALASVSSTGEVTAILPGTAIISATLSGVTGTATVTINRPPLLSLAVNPATAVVDQTSTFAFSAVATYVDASTEVVTSLVTWSSSDVSFATINAAGVATGVLPGTVTITAQWGAQSGTSQLTVNSRSLVSIAITGRAKFAVGTAVQLLATGTWSDSTTSDVTALATWASSAPATADFTNLAGVKGLAQGLAVGSTNVTATVTTVTSAVFAVQVLATNAPYAGRCGPGLVMSQVYGGGGNSGAAWRNDFVELHNPTGAGISLGGLSLQYTSAAGSSWGSNLVPLSNVVVPAGGFFLVQLGSGGANGTVLSPDQLGVPAINMSATSGKIALVNGTSALTGNCPSVGVIDFVGYGAADCFEGVVAPGPSAAAWLTRGASGCRDGNTNNVDFTTTTTIVPRILSSAGLLCSCFVNGSAASEQLNSCVLQSPASLGVAAAGDVTPAVSALVTQPGVTDTAGFDANLRVEVGFGATGVNPTTTAGWRWWPGPGSTSGSVSDAYSGVFVSPLSGTWPFTARASRDGVNWTACDLNGAGSGSGLAFEMGQLGLLTVP